jgi:hypothetical protein
MESDRLDDRLIINEKLIISDILIIIDRFIINISGSDRLIPHLYFKVERRGKERGL